MASFLREQKRGIGGLPPNKCICSHEMSVANEVASKYDACQTKNRHCEMRKFLTSKEIMIATSVAIGAGFKLD